MPILTIAPGLLLAFAGWWLVRRVARTAPGVGAALTLLDAAAPFLWFAILLAASARPLFAGVVSFSTFGGLAFADYFKRLTLREPVVFCDSAELIEVVRHPGLYLPFAGPKRVMAGAAVAFGAYALLLVLEPAAWRWSWLELVSVCAGCAAALSALLWPMQGWVTRALGPIAVTGDPSADGARLGPLVTLLVYGVRARAERKPRADRATADSRLAATPGPAPGHVVLIQCESFVDPRHLFDDPDAGPLANLDLARTSGPLHGRLLTPAWGANTVRTEFEAITGVGDEDLGFDRFNPYYAFVRRRLPSLAWSLKARGYRTVCVHPYSRNFYNRHRVLPRLGFDAFHGIEAFKRASTRRGYVTDAAVADFAEGLLRRATQPTFVFVITMENHGPWTPAAGEPGSERDIYMDGVASGDALLGRLGRAVGADRGEGLAAFYGDHCPMLSEMGEDGRTDYVIWRGGGPARAQDLPASSLALACLEALDR